MRLNLTGSVDELPVTPANGIHAVFEAVSNSIHAIREAGGSDGVISVGLVRDTRQADLELTPEGKSDGRGEAEIVEVRVTDNGVGFVAPNFSAFGELYTRRKARLGAKGVGRLTWLKVFDQVRVSSIYREGAEWHRRTFEFRLPNGIEHTQDEVLPDGGQGVASTTVVMSSPRPEFRTGLRRKAVTIRDAIMRHFLAELLAPDPPRIEIVDAEEALEVGLAGVSGRLTGQFIVKEQPFKIEHLKLRSPERTHHMVYFCADRRSVRPERIRQLPDDRLHDGENEFFYHAYVSSDYLDSRVDQQRLGFAIEEEADLVPEPSFGEIRTAVYNAAHEYLEPHLHELERQKEERIAKVLDETFPEQAYLRHQNQPDLARIPLTASEDEIRNAVARIHFGNVRSGRELMDSIVEDMKNSSTIDFTSFIDRFGPRLRRDRTAYASKPRQLSSFPSQHHRHVSGDHEKEQGSL